MRYALSSWLVISHNSGGSGRSNSVVKAFRERKSGAMDYDAMREALAARRRRGKAENGDDGLLVRFFWVLRSGRGRGVARDPTIGEAKRASCSN